MQLSGCLQSSPEKSFILHMQKTLSCIDSFLQRSIGGVHWTCYLFHALCEQ